MVTKKSPQHNLLSLVSKTWAFFLLFGEIKGKMWEIVEKSLLWFEAKFSVNQAICVLNLSDFAGEVEYPWEVTVLEEQQSKPFLYYKELFFFFQRNSGVTSGGKWKKNKNYQYQVNW